MKLGTCAERLGRIAWTGIAGVCVFASGCGGRADVSISLGGAQGLTALADSAATSDSTGGDDTRANGLYLHVVETRIRITDVSDDTNESQNETGDTGVGHQDRNDEDDEFQGTGSDENIDDSNENADADDEDDSSWVVVSHELRDVDLLALEGTSEEIAAGSVPTGVVSELRFILAEGSQATLVSDGHERDVVVPSGSSSGMKLKIRPPVTLLAEGRYVFEAAIKGTFETGSGVTKLRPTAKVTVSERPAEPSE